MAEPLLDRDEINKLWPIVHKRKNVPQTQEQNGTIASTKDKYSNSTRFNVALDQNYERSTISWTTYKANKKQIK